MDALGWATVGELVPWDRNPRRNDEAVDPLARSIAALGFGAPLLARPADRRVIAGHTRLRAALWLVDHDLVDGVWIARKSPWTVDGAPEPGMVPVRWLDVDDAKATQIAVADNRLGELATWDDQALTALVRDLYAGGHEVHMLGLADADLASMLADLPSPDDLGGMFDPPPGGDAPPGVTNTTGYVNLVIPLVPADRDAVFVVLAEIRRTHKLATSGEALMHLVRERTR